MIENTRQSTHLTDRQAANHVKAILQAVLVTFLWSTSWILIKFGLRANLPALTFAGLRYGLAFVCLAPLVLLNSRHRNSIRSLAAWQWRQLILLGVVFYVLTQGAQFVSLALLPAAPINLLLNLTPIVVALFSGMLLAEPPSTGQWGGILLSLLGVGVYFLPLDLPPGRLLGLAVAVAGMLANAGAALLGRQVNRSASLDPLLVTFISMGVGAVLLLALGIGWQGWGVLGWQQWGIILWLAVVNTALAFTLWNRSLVTLSAVESSLLNSLMMPQIVIMAWVILGEALGWRQIIGLALGATGVLIVQLRR